MNTAVVGATDVKDVTVAVRVRNQAAALDACLASVLVQSLGTDRLEVIGVDDGSTDESGSVLARAAHQYPAFVRAGQVSPGLSAAGARNWALSQVRGRYVIFLDATDRLAPDALERMVAAADAYEADVVLGKLESSGRHTVETSMFRKNQAYTDLYATRAYWSLTPDKLFRTSLLQRRGLAFPTDMLIGDDQAFTARALIGADNVSVVGDAPCVVKGPSPATRATLPDRVALASRMLALVASQLPEGPRRDRLQSRHLEVELGKATAAALLSATDAAERDQALWAAAEVLRTQASPGALALLPRMVAVRFALLAQGRFAEAQRMAAFEADKDRPAVRKTVEEGRVFTTLPFFRDPQVALPDELFDITDDMTVTHQLEKAHWDGPMLLLEGFAFFEQLSTKDRATRVVLRERTSGAQESCSVTARRDDALTNAKGRPRAMGRFSCRVNLGQTSSGWPLPPGTWDLHLAVGFEGVTQEVRLGPKRSADLDTTARMPVPIGAAPDAQGMELAATPYYTESGGLSIEVSRRTPLPRQA
ncbi:glycosyltransferase family 2 protein [Streptomyces sp. NRRL S-244]|uniref:glycosyltransferase family 2 protein n=1 Tax=Streptomyces sp. NRRL S-244 TaxID=1463897 RepID=UPI0006915C22|nr:glycosyltransferase family 2 protein [Streptomyces sp. NRRL S-244]